MGVPHRVGHLKRLRPFQSATILSMNLVAMHSAHWCVDALALFDRRVHRYIRINRETQAANTLPIAGKP
jgi:hypothetical protein